MSTPTRSPWAYVSVPCTLAKRTNRFLKAALLAALAVLMGGTQLAGAQGAAAADAPAIPPRFATTTAHTDIPGGDLDSIFNITLERCHAACLANGDCAAFTFNQRNGACFLKSEAGEAESYLDAMSGVVTQHTAQELENANQAAEQLTFLSDYDFDLAREMAANLALSHNADGYSESDWLNSARTLGGEQAIIHSAIAATINDSGQAWLAHAQARLAVALEAETRSFDHYRRTANAAINAVLRLTEPERAEAVLILSRALEGIGRGEDALEAMRLAHRITPNIAPEDLARLRELFGFRVLRHDIETQTAAPRICVYFSSNLDATIDYDQYISRQAQGLAVEADGQQICVSGVQYGERYSLTVRAGLPAVDAETIVNDVALDVYIRDRNPYVTFPGNAYVLPAAGPRALPVETVNADHLELTLLRVTDRNLIATIRQGSFLQALGTWQTREFEELVAERVWTGEAFLEIELNRNTTSLLPLNEVGDLEPGVYVLRAQVAGKEPYDVTPATQWFLISDLGVTTLSGNDGVHVVVQSLSTGQPLPDLSVQLLAGSNRVLGQTTTDDAGHAHFGAGVTLGQGNLAPAAVLIDAATDFTVLSLQEPEFDLSDRGVAGRESPGPLDVFMTTDRGAYRVGETINLTTLVRDAKAAAISGLPLTVRLIRPDGVIYSTVVSTDDRAGGYVLPLALGPSVPLGVWRIEALIDTTAAPLATRTVLVEDFIPDRIDVQLALQQGDQAIADPVTTLLDPAANPSLNVNVWHLFGAPAAGMNVSGQVIIAPADTLPGWDGYTFGRFDQRAGTQLRPLAANLVTDEQGTVVTQLPLDRLPQDARPFRVIVQATALDGSSRPVERSVSAPLLPGGPMVGIRQLFDGPLPENGQAGFDLVIANPDGTAGTGNLLWQVDRVTTRYQWFSYSGRWYWEPITERQRVAEGSTRADGGSARADGGSARAQGDSAQISVPVGWGRYELRVTYEERPSVSSSVWFSAGWYSADARDTPDLLTVSLDADTYAAGDVARLRIVPEEPGVALVTVLSDRVISMDLVQVDGETTVELPVTDEWGGGAYVTASLIRPSDSPEHLPARSMGLAHADVDPGARALAVSISAPAEVRSGETLTITLDVSQLAGTSDTPVTAYATVAVVDVGVLNVTGFLSPDPQEYYFGQRRLGVAIRDLYGRLIDARQGAPGDVRSGGDGLDGDSSGPVPTEDLLSLFSGPVEVVNGQTQVSFDLPPFSGAVRVMAVVWTDQAVGQAAEEVLVRDPVVVQGSLPRFLTPGDVSRLRLELTHADGPAGTVQIEVEGHGLGAMTGGVVSASEGERSGSGSGDGAASKVTVSGSVELTEGGRAVIDVPLAPTRTGDHTYIVTITSPEGHQHTRELRLTVLYTDPEVVQTTRQLLEAGASIVLNDDTLAAFRPGTAGATVAAGVGGALDLPGQIVRLSGYAYGSTERIASSLQPYLRAGNAVSQMGLRTQAEVRDLVQEGVDRLLTRQGRTGSFGVWGSGGGDTWLDAYVTETLLLSEAFGADVPEVALRMALDNLRNELSYAGNMHDGSQAYAYALYVLAQAGEAAIGDMRYYADVIPERFLSPLSVAHLGAALATYGERGRAESMFARAHNMVYVGDHPNAWRPYYGSQLREAAAVLALAAEHNSTVVDRERLATFAAGLAGTDYLSSQESAWMLRAAVALGAQTTGLELNGQPLTGAALALYDGQPLTLTNVSNAPIDVTVTVAGVPVDAPDATGNGYTIQRNLYATNGDVADLSNIRAGDRLVVILEITPNAGVRGGPLIIDDALPAGLEIDNANLLRSGDVRGLDWLEIYSFADSTQARADRFVAAVPWTTNRPLYLAYMVRAVSDGTFHYPAPLVVDQYRPSLRAIGETGVLEVGK